MKTTDKKPCKKPPITRKWLCNISGTPMPEIQRKQIGQILRNNAIQAKLSNGEAREQYEQEADRVTDEVIDMPQTRESSSAACEEYPPQTRAKTTTPAEQARADPREDNEDERELEDEKLVQTKILAGKSVRCNGDVESQIALPLGGGNTLPASERAFFEPRFGADFSQVRTHEGEAEQVAAARLNAKAFTYRDHIWLGPGASIGDRKLLAHELTHVLQQGAHKETGAAAFIQRTSQRRSSLHTEWYVEMEPATSIVPVGTEVTFRLKNSANLHYAAWATEKGENRPLIGVKMQGGSTQTWLPRYPRYPMTLKQTFNHPGHVEVFFQGRPLRGVGPHGQPAAMTLTGSKIYVSVELDIVKHLTKAAVEAAPSQATLREDINRLEDPHASGPELAEAFKRIAVRRGIDIVNRNKQEALDLLQMYTKGASGRTATQATRELQSVLGLYSRLGEQIYRLKAIPGEGLRAARRAGVDVRGGDQYRKFILGKIKEINLVRASLIDAFPAMALSLTGGPRATMVRRGRIDQAQWGVQSLLRRVLRDCDTTRRGLATEDLHIFDVNRVVADVRKTLGIDADPRKRRALDKAIQKHRKSSLAQSLGLAGAALVLLFVPGLGPYLAAAAGLGAAGISWERAGDLLAAAGAGVREGIVGGAEAGAAIFWASIETLLVGLEAAAAIKPLTRIMPHAPAAAERIVPVVRSAGGKTSPRAAWQPLAETGGRVSGAGHPWSMSASHLCAFFQRLMGRALRVSRQELHFYNSMDEFVAAVRTVYRRAGQTVGPDEARRFRGIFDPSDGHIHISPEASLRTVIHEALHRYARDRFSWGPQLCGEFLHEGIVQRIANSLFRPSTPTAYQANMRFVISLERRFGRAAVWNVLLESDGYVTLRAAVKRALGGSEARTYEFFRLVRSGDEASARQAVQMLEGS